jgi:adenylate cyclase
VRSELIPLLEETLLEASDDRLYRIRPYALADAWKVDRQEVLRLFLHGAHLGLFELRWELLCPNCRVPKAEANRLGDLPKRYHCDTCGIDYATEFDERVELRFSVHPSVRRVDGAVYCIGGPLRTPHIVAQQYLRANEGRRLEVDVAKPLRLRAVGGEQHLQLVPNAESRWSSEVSVIYANGRWTGPHSLMAGDDSLAIPAHTSLNMRNQTAGPLLAVVEDVEWTKDATTAAEIMTLTEFQQLFKSEMLAAGEEITVKEVALLTSRLLPTGSLFAPTAATETHSRRALHEEFVNERSTQGRGGLVKVRTEMVTSAFYRIGDALATAIGAQRAVGAWSASRRIEPPLELAMGVHAGPVTAFNGEERLEYFGRTVDVADRLASEAEGGDIVLFARVLDDTRAALSPEPTPFVVERFSARRSPDLGDEPLARLAPGSEAAARRI